MENIYQTYARVICSECANRYNDNDLCNITRTNEDTVKCFNYERCMQIKCNICKFYDICFEKGV